MSRRHPSLRAVPTLAAGLAGLALAVACSGTSSPPPPVNGNGNGNAAAARRVTFVNRCPYPVWVGYTGSSASDTPCTSRKATVGGSADCTPGNPCTQCPGQGACSSQGKCECTSDAQCPDHQTCRSDKKCGCTSDASCGAHQVCDTPANDWHQCYWKLESPEGGWGMPGYANGNDNDAAPPARVVLLPGKGSARDATIVWSGAFFPKTGCTDGKQCATGDNLEGYAWQGPTQAHVRAEFTLQNQRDYYDISLMHGFNTPVQVGVAAPAGKRFDPTVGSEAFRCGVIGGKTYSSPAVPGYTGREHYGCSYAFDAIPAAYQPASTSSWPRYYQLVSSEDAGAPACTDNANCNANAHQVCGLPESAVKPGGDGQTRCGALVGYWSDHQVCGGTNQAFVGGPFACNKALPVPFASMTSLLGCVRDYGNSNTNANANSNVDLSIHELSCYQVGKSDPKCCGCVAWDFTGGAAALPTDLACQATNPTWTAEVLPRINFLKYACPMAYSYPFDDESSTWQCATMSANVNAARASDDVNAVEYTLTFCPDGMTGGVTSPGGGGLTCDCADNHGAWIVSVGSSSDSAKQGYVDVYDQAGTWVWPYDLNDNTNVNGNANRSTVYFKPSVTASPYDVQLRNAGGVRKSCRFLMDPLTRCLTKPIVDDSHSAVEDCAYFSLLPRTCNISAPPLQ